MQLDNLTPFTECEEILNGDARDRVVLSRSVYETENIVSHFHTLSISRKT